MPGTCGKARALCSDCRETATFLFQSPVYHLRAQQQPLSCLVKHLVRSSTCWDQTPEQTGYLLRSYMEKEGRIAASNE